MRGYGIREGGPTPTLKLSGSLLDHLVGGHLQRQRHGQAENPRCLEIDHQFELCPLHDRKVGVLGARKDSSDIDAHLTVRVRKVAAVAHQAADRGVLTQRARSRAAFPPGRLILATRPNLTGSSAVMKTNRRGYTLVRECRYNGRL